MSWFRKLLEKASSCHEPSRERHPPKKKQAIKPRSEPVAQMSDDERKVKAEQEFQKAIVHLAEAERIGHWGEAPNACVHSAYYAMHHCAAAAILAAGGVGKRRDVPQSHEHVIQHYGNLIASETGFLGQSGMILSRAAATAWLPTTILFAALRNPKQKRQSATPADSSTLAKRNGNSWQLRFSPSIHRAAAADFNVRLKRFHAGGAVDQHSYDPQHDADSDQHACDLVLNRVAAGPRAGEERAA